VCRLSLISDSGELTTSHYLAMSYLLTLSEKGGNTHGTGIGTPVDFIKFAGPASSVVLLDQYIEWVRKTEKVPTHTLLGHTRLASGEFRKTGGDYESSESHPFSYGSAGNWGSVYHNGTFKEFEIMAAVLGLPTKHGLTDTAIFAQLLGAQTNGAAPSVKDLIDTYEACGKADYSMFITHITKPEITVVRGNKTLYKAKSNLGLIINTEQSNITGLPKLVNPAFKMLGFDPLEVEIPVPITMWTINTVLDGTFTKVEDINKLKEVNDPITTPVTNYTRYKSVNPYYQGNLGHGGGFDDLPDDDEKIDIGEIAKRAEAMISISVLALDGLLGNDELNYIFSEIYGDTSPWFAYKAEQLTEVGKLFGWSWTKYEKTRVTDKKLGDWNAFKKVCRQAGHYSAPSMYREANRVLKSSFSCPWFLNDPEELNTLAALVSEVMFDDSADDSWPA